MSVQHTDASRLRMAQIRDERLVAQRSRLSPDAIAEVVGVLPGDDVVMASGRVYPWSEFVPAYRAGDIMNAYRRIIERGGKLR